jgi:hypothetical protein
MADQTTIAPAALDEAGAATYIAHWLREVAAGRDPARPESNAPIDWPVRMRAARMYLDLERALGMPAQSIHVDAELRAVDAPAAPPPEAFEKMGPEARAVLRQCLAALLAQRPGGEPEPEGEPGPGARGAWNRHVRARLGSGQAD